jgi:hypothetical protein
MSDRAIYSVQKVDSKKIWVACQRCEKETQHQPLTKVTESDESPDGDIQVWNDYLTLVCGGCNTISFCIASKCSEGRDPYTGEFDVSYQLHPSRVAGRPQMRAVRSLPHAIYQIYQETHEALCSKKPILAGIGIRAILESLCKVKGVVGRNLEIKIDNLAEMGLIARDSANFLHRIRSLGNKAAHEVAAHSDLELAAAMEIVEQLLQAVFVLPVLASSLPAPPSKPVAKPSAKSIKTKSTSKHEEPI